MPRGEDKSSCRPSGREAAQHAERAVDAGRLDNMFRLRYALESAHNSKRPRSKVFSSFVTVNLRSDIEDT
jgi:hypothetical protein